MNEKRFKDIWCSETGHIGVTDYGIDKEFTSIEFEDFLNELNDENKTLNVVPLLNELNDENKELKKENEQLKRQNKALKDSYLTDAYNRYIRTCTVQSNRE